MTATTFPLFLLLGTSLLLSTGCGLRSTATDPEALQAQLKASKVAERQLLEDVVEDTERAETFGLLLDERDTIVTEYADVVADYITDMRALNSDYDASAEDFERLITDYRSARQSYQQDLVSVIQRMKATTNEKEWKRLAKFQLQELNPRETTQSKGGA